MQHPAPTAAGGEAPLHTTSDLLRLLALEGQPFCEVAAAVVQRFGGDTDSVAWLARTLVTLLRDGLLYTEVEKMNAAYLLRFVSPGLPGSREALLHMSLPGSGEPAAVRAWAATLAAAPTLPEHQPSTVASSVQQQSAAAVHLRSPRQVLAEADSPQGGQHTYSPLSPHTLPQPPAVPSQVAASAAAAQQAAAAAGGGSSIAASPPRSSSAASSSTAVALGAPPGWGQQAAGQVQQGDAHSGSMPAPTQQVQQAAQQQALQQLQQQQQEVERLLVLLQQAAEAPLVPATQQRLAQALSNPSIAAPLATLLSEAVNGSGSASSHGSANRDAVQPEHMGGLVEHNAPVAAQLLLALSEHAAEAAAVYTAAVAELPMSAQGVECMSAVISKAPVPDWVLTTFLSNCMQDTNSCQDGGRQSRQVKLLCACVNLVLQRQPAALSEGLPELLAFCIQQSRYKQAAELYRQLRDLEQQG